MKVNWSKHYDFNNWFFETDAGHVAGTVEEKRTGFEAGVSMPYHINDDGEEQDWRPLGTFPTLEDAKAAVEENATQTIQGERLIKRETGFYAVSLPY